jgi:hypothetical protein
MLCVRAYVRVRACVRQADPRHVHRVLEARDATVQTHPLLPYLRICAEPGGGANHETVIEVELMVSERGGMTSPGGSP